MAKIKQESETFECEKCISALKINEKLHCKNMIKDINLPLTVYSEVTIKKDCGYYREKK